MEEDGYMLAAEAQDAEKRLDVFVTEALEGISRSAVQRLLGEGRILWNGSVAKPNTRLRAGDVVTVTVPAATPLNVEPENIPLDIYYEDAELLVVNKPQGMVVHPAAGHLTGTLVNALLWHCAGSLSGINGVLRPGIVHRIDKETSGLLVVAKTDAAHLSLAKQLAAHSMTRRYRALCFFDFKEDSGTVSAPIGRHPSDRKKMAVNSKNGKAAVTHWKVLERFGKYTYLECRLKTGRTHQIRVHMSYIGHPLVGDLVYGPAKQPFPLAGQALHAQVLGFVHPITEQYLEFSAPLPTYFENLLQKLRT